ncbi:hypothetical protein RKD49_000109 [Streptomyces glaucescens]
MVSTGLKIADLIDRLDGASRPRAELADDGHAAESLAADVPALTPVADWLLDQIAARDAPAQQLRAVLEPDISDCLRDRQAGSTLAGITTPALDAPRAAHLAQARATVRAYTAAAHSGVGRKRSNSLTPSRSRPVPLAASGPATAWRKQSAAATGAVEALAAQRAATTAEAGTDFFADPERLHAQTSYLAA